MVAFGSIYGTCHKKLQNLTNSAEILCGFLKASMQLTAELHDYFYRVCLRVLQNDSSKMNAQFVCVCVPMPE